MPSFRTKARAIDLLGKGQIADLPTAISELWKNGYDAYADNLRCDLFLRGYKGLNHHIFTLSDDGTGMSRQDIEEKWIVLGTDSRVRGEEVLSEVERLGKPPRIPLGEKGIGRLSVSYLGSPMLMLTKKIDDICNVLFMDWRILDNYNLYIDDVDIPISRLSSKNSINNIINELTKQFENNLSKGDWQEHKSLKKRILKEINSLTINEELADEIFDDFNKKEYHGTKFVIFNPHEQLIDFAGTDISDINTSEKSAVQYLRSSLGGIHNAFAEEPPFSTAFILHDQKGVYNLIEKQDFFDFEDMSNADHWVKGTFNEEGFFNGEVRIFNKRTKHTFHPRRPSGKTPYGPYKIEFGFMEGDPKNSKLPREKWDQIKKKLDSFGGLYIYRDNFRVLPYGRSDYDFLKFEERRSYSATYYQFSHRRIFGYIGISRKQNPKLRDKAGREGFIINKAVREFYDDLIQFFVDISVRYLRTRTKDEKEKEEIPTWREEQVDEIRKRNERLLKAEKKRSKMSKNRFNKELKENIKHIEIVKEEIIDLNNKLIEEMKKERIVYNNISNIITEIENKKSEIRKMKLIKPKRIEITTNQMNKYIYYKEKYSDVLELIKKCNNVISDSQKVLSKENLKEEYNKKYIEYNNNIESNIKDYEYRFKSKTNEINQDIKEKIQQYSDLYAEKTSHLLLKGNENNDEIERRIRNLEIIQESILDEIEDQFDSFIQHIEGLTFDIDDDLLVGWYKEQYEKIEEQVEAMHELAQLGMAIEIIDHQFNVLYAEMSSSIEFFKQFSEKKPEIKYNYNQLRQSFEHLETNHKLLTPLYRTMRRSKVEISGEEIYEYLKKFFSKRFDRHKIKLTITPSFSNYIFYTYESVIKPVFINIINNAIYWLIPADEREIQITYEDEKIIIMNSGDRIDTADLDNIFTLFFSRKPGGRGIGLYLAKTNLHSIEYDIYATNEKKYNRLNGACFIINKMEGY